LISQFLGRKGSFSALGTSHKLENYWLFGQNSQDCKHLLTRHDFELRSLMMAKSARASKIKTNNSKLKTRVFGPIESARTERLSAKLLELASQPKPAKKDSGQMPMDVEGGN
jgi:hypothetical protein